MLKIFKGSLRLVFFAMGSLFCLSCICSCAAYLKTESELNDFIARGQYRDAASFLDSREKTYGSNNRLLYLFDKGYILHISNGYRDSIDTFQKAKHKYDELYTKSVSRILGSLIINDYALPYRGEDFERAMVNVFQALNYSMLGDIEGALVEAKDADAVLNLINSRYQPGQKNVYSDDAFIHLLMGILYEQTMGRQGYNDAFIAYSKAADIYENNYAKNYDLEAPLLLKENLFAGAQFMGKEELDRCISKYGNLKFMSLDQKAKNAEVYLIQYNGFSPIKIQITIPILLPNGYLMPLAFPEYARVGRLVNSSRLSAENKNRVILYADTQLAEDIEAIAVRNLENRKARLIAKVIAGSGAKYAAETTGQSQIRRQHGQDAAAVFNIGSNLYNFVTNKADLRSWRTIPSEIRIARLLLDPGEYNFSVDNFSSGGQLLEKVYLGHMNLSAGEKKFLIVRTTK